jgi:hypothetical protein
LAGGKAHLTAASEPIASLTITVFTRHSADCQKQDDPQWKRRKSCKCFFIFEDDEIRFLADLTSSLERAERRAQSERDKRAPGENRTAKKRGIGGGQKRFHDQTFSEAPEH